MLTREELLDVVGKSWWEGKNLLIEFVQKHLSAAGVRIFALEHCAFAAHFPQWFGNIIANCPYIEARRYMIENMFVEEVRDPTVTDGHYESLVKFGIGLGLKRDDIVNYRPSISMRMALHYWDNISRTKPWLQGFAAVGGLEVSNHAELAARYGQVPLVSKKIWAPLRLPDSALTHWQAAEVADPHEGGHGEETLRILIEYARTKEEEERVKAALGESVAVFRYQYDQIGKAAIEASQRKS